MNAALASVRYWPEHWLILSPRVYETIRLQPRRADGLLQLRLAGGLIEALALEQLEGRLRELGSQDPAIVHLVFEHLDLASARRLYQLHQLAPVPLDIRLHDWHEAPHQVLMSLGLPDLSITAAIEAFDEGTPMDAPRPTSAVRSNAIWLQRYRHALVRWELDARLQHGAAFDLVYSPSPLPWQQLLPIRPLPWTQRTVAWVFESLILLLQLFFAPAGASHSPRTARFRAIPGILAAPDAQLRPDTLRALVHAYLAWPIWVLMLAALAMAALANDLSTPALIWAVCSATLLAMAGGLVCGPVVSVLGVGSGGVAMAFGFALVNGLLASLPSGLQALAARAADIDPFVLVVHGIVGNASALIAARQPAWIAALLSVPAIAITVTAWLMGRPEDAHGATTTGSTPRRLGWGLLGSAAGAGIGLIKGLSLALAAPLHSRDLGFLIAAVTVASACYGTAIWLRTSDRRAALRFGLAYGLLGALLWSAAMAWRGTVAGLYLAGPATGFFHASFFTLAYVVGLRFAGRGAAFLAAGIEGCVGFVLFNGLLIFGKL